jgi:hypothetical protein
MARVLGLGLFALSSVAAYSPEMASKFVGAQHWTESGLYATKGLSEHYDGYFCLCSCNATPEGIFCAGAGVQPTGDVVGEFLGVFSESRGGGYEGDLVAYGTDTPFADRFTLEVPGGPANYTGVSQKLDGESFVWRGRMHGVSCDAAEHCVDACDGREDFGAWLNECEGVTREGSVERME